LHAYAYYARIFVPGAARAALHIAAYYSLCDNFISKGDEVNIVDDQSAGRLAKGVILRVEYIQ
jgi:hypothetical protein